MKRCLILLIMIIVVVVNFLAAPVFAEFIPIPNEEREENFKTIKVWLDNNWPTKEEYSGLTVYQRKISDPQLNRTDNDMYARGHVYFVSINFFRILSFNDNGVESSLITEEIMFYIKNRQIEAVIPSNRYFDNTSRTSQEIQNVK